MKNKVDKLDADKLIVVPVDLSKLNNVLKYDLVKKNEYSELKKFDNISTTDTSNLDKKNRLKIENKINDHNHDKYITTQEFNELTSANLAAILKQTNLASKTDIANFIKKTYFDENIKNSNRSKIKRRAR